MSAAEDVTSPAPVRLATGSVPARTLHVRGPWTADRIALVGIAALLPAAVVAVADRPGLGTLGVIAVALVVVYGWQAVFAFVRGTLIGFDGIGTAIALGLLLPGPASLVEVVLATSAGIVLGELAFGGRGRSFLSPAAVGAAFFAFSFPAAFAAQTPDFALWPVIAGAALLLALGLANWRVLVGAYAGLAVAAWMGGTLDWGIVSAGPFAFAMVFLAADPPAAAATNPGRLVYGFLIGALAILFGADTSAAIFAVLLGQVFAPLIDWSVIRVSRRPKMRRPWLD